MPYKILRFRFRGKTTTVKSGLTLAQAQKHCENPKTHGKNWFDGYSYYKPRKKAKKRKR